MMWNAIYLIMIVLLLGGCATTPEQRAMEAYRWCIEHFEKYPLKDTYMNCYCTPDSYGSTGRMGPMHCVPNYRKLLK